jgi:hypothetical protein
MSTDDFGDLLDGLRAIHAITAEVNRELSLPLPEPQEALKRLSALIATIGRDKPVKLRHCPEEYRTQWQQFVSGNRRELELRAVRFLCWEPNVATDLRFHDFLDRAHIALGSRALQGLVRTCHQEWSRELAYGPVSASLRRRLTNFSGSNRAINKWKENIRLIAGADAPRLFAAQMVNESVAPAIVGKCAQWAIPERSAFISEVVHAASDLCRERLDGNSRLVPYLLTELLPWLDRWEIGEFKKLLGAWILSSDAERTEELREGLKRLALNKLSDPRLPINAKAWFGIQEAARSRLLQWLSRADIVFFFDHVLPKGRDPHRRKQFWLEYVNRVKQSRPLLNYDDRTRLMTLPAQVKDKIGHYGKIEGLTSAFLLDFGNVVVIEFSAAGNACYVYARARVPRLIPDFWTDSALYANGPRSLKQAGLYIERIVHRAGWQNGLRMLLASYGIRAETQRNVSNQVHT